MKSAAILQLGASSSHVRWYVLSLTVVLLTGLLLRFCACRCVAALIEAIIDQANDFGRIYDVSHPG